MNCQHEDLINIASFLDRCTAEHTYLQYPNELLDLFYHIKDVFFVA